jgi:NAD(P)-dependent dehydrogenase (short-subunit alcohol dehydrogenase family)/carbon monoxide dehydrogenase subunit G
VIRLQETIEVNRPLADVFQYTSEFSNVEQWDPGVASATRLNPGPLGVGSEYRVLVKLGPRRLPMHYTITRYEPPSRVVLEGKSTTVNALDDIRFEPTATGTRIVYTADLSFQGWFSYAESLLKSRLDGVGKAAIAGLRQVLTEELPVPERSWIGTLQDRLILPGMLGFTRLGYDWHKRSWRPLAASLRGQTVVITGVTAGLGRAAAERLARLGARVILVGRNPAKLEETRQAISVATGHRELVTLTADLSLLAEVNRLADQLLAEESRIHCLINNAGVLLNERTVTAEGIEATLATNLLAPFLLTNRLLPRLRESAPARVINVSSGGMYTSGLALDDLPMEQGTYSGSVAYARTKRALVILTELWAEQLKDSGVVVHAMHPGWAATPGVVSSLPGFYRLTRPLLRTPEQGADTIVWLAVAPEAAKVSGLFWLDREPHITHVFPGTQETAADRQRLWTLLAGLTNIADVASGDELPGKVREN